MRLDLIRALATSARLRLNSILSTNPLVYSFVSGAAISLAGNIYCSVRLSSAKSLPASKARLYTAASFLVLSGVCAFYAGMQRERLRDIQLSINNPPEQDDLMRLLGKPANFLPITVASILAVVASVISIICLSSH